MVTILCDVLDFYFTGLCVGYPQHVVKSLQAYAIWGCSHSHVLDVHMPMWWMFTDPCNGCSQTCVLTVSFTGALPAASVSSGAAAVAGVLLHGGGGNPKL